MRTKKKKKEKNRNWWGTTRFNEGGVYLRTREGRSLPRLKRRKPPALPLVRTKRERESGGTKEEAHQRLQTLVVVREHGKGCIYLRGRGRTVSTESASGEWDFAIHTAGQFPFLRQEALRP